MDEFVNIIEPAVAMVSEFHDHVAVGLVERAKHDHPLYLRLVKVYYDESCEPLGKAFGNVMGTNWSNWRRHRKT